jgi:hypothetical protein
VRITVVLNVIKRRKEIFALWLGVEIWGGGGLVLNQNEVDFDQYKEIGFSILLCCV